MSHAHDHSHAGYYTEQLCTIGLCGALAGVSIRLWASGALTILADPFPLAVLIGGIVLLLVVVVRAVSLWQSVATHSHEHLHEHEHTPDHAHDHYHHHPPAHEHAHGHMHVHVHAHDPDHVHEDRHEHAPDQSLPTPPPEPSEEVPAAHAHGHEHGWTPLRFVVLMLPLALCFLGLPNPEFNRLYAKYKFNLLLGELPPLFSPAAARGASARIDLRDVGLLNIPSQGKDTINLGFQELDQAAYNEQGREFYQGKTGRIIGQFVPGPDRTAFTLARLKMTCCTADSIVLRLQIFSPEPVENFELQQWVEVTGQIQFRETLRGDEYRPVLQLRSARDVVPIDPPTNPFLK